MGDRAPEALLHVRGLTKRFGGVIATDSLDLEILSGELHALIGPNGAGKTTAIAQISGEIAPTAGTIHFSGAEISRRSVPARVRLGLARTYQIAQLLPDFSAEDSVALAVQVRSGHSFRFWKCASLDPALRGPAREYLGEVGLTSRGHVPVGELSHGEQRQLEIAMALATNPRLLMLDEPLAGMGPSESRDMADLLNGLKRRVAILLVEHDMEVVFSLADRITVLVFGRRIASGSPDEIRLNSDVRAAYLGDERVDAIR
jgi:branched-chain amino acid transport system ATP-binding protein